MMEPEAKEDSSTSSRLNTLSAEVQGQQVRPNFSGTSKFSGTQQEVAAHSGEGVLASISPRLTQRCVF